jgi:AGCS family alanine or glycine:cation symporter
MDLNIIHAHIIQWNELMNFWIVFPALIVIGLLFTIRLRFIQFSQMKTSFNFLVGKSSGDGSISHFEAVAAVLAGNLGTGNISGIAVALTTGGPGALVWMWVVALLGTVVQYASCILGAVYRHQNAQGDYVGGPMFYLSKGLNWKKMATVFSVFTIIGAFTAGNFAQINSVVLPLEEIHINPFWGSVVIAILTGIVLIGGIQRFARVASAVVPLKALLYLGAATIILFLHADKVWPALVLMFQAALSPSALFGGALGYGVVKTVTTGLSRGIFATDAGTGIAPMLQSSARSSDPVVNGLVALVPPFFVMLVCTITGLVLLVTDAWTTGLQSTNMCTYAFRKGLNSEMGFYVVIVSLFAFAYTTVLAWAYCAQQAVAFLWGDKAAYRFNFLFVALIPVGSLVNVSLIWAVADVAIAVMMLTNLAGVAALFEEVVYRTKQYFKSNPDTQAA